MLTFLRGIYSVAKAQIAIPLSNHRDNFSWFSKNEQKRALNISRVSERPVIELKKNIRAHSTGIEFDQKPITIKNDLISHRKRNLQGLRGNGEITSWISNIPSINSSLYQDSYIPQFYVQKNPAKADFHTSIVFKLLPNKY